MGSSEAFFYFPKGFFYVEGPDSGDFLQGQFSNDLRVSVGEAVYGFWLTVKGKILGDSWVLKRSESSFLIYSYGSETAVLRENLESRIIMDEVETRLPESEVVAVSLWGGAIGIVADAFGLEEVPENGFQEMEGVLAFWGRRGSGRCLEVSVLSPDFSDRLKRIAQSSDIRILDTQEVGARAVKSGLFQIFEDVSVVDLPQETGLAEAAVSYRKGCYIGQEVMARLKAMGRTRKSLEAVAVSRMPEGEPPWALLDAGGKKSGELRRVLRTELGLLGSAMLKRREDGLPLLFVESQPEVEVVLMNKEPQDEP